MFGRRKKDGREKELPLKKRVRDMKCRKVSFVDCDFDELTRDMRETSTSILKLVPVNYYAVKNTYILALIYTTPDYRESYVQLKRIEYEKQTDESEIYALDEITLTKVLAKVGIIIDVEAAREALDADQDA